MMPANLGPLAATALVAAASAGWLDGLLALPAAAVLVVAWWRRSDAWVRILAALLVALAAAFFWYGRAAERRLAEETQLGLKAELRGVQERARELLERLSRDAARAAALPVARDALAGRAEARSPAFRALEELRSERAFDVALALHKPDWSPVAWSGRTVELVPFRELIGSRDVFALEGSVSTTLVAAVDVLGASGARLGAATAELTVSTRRNIHNEYLRDFDLLAGSASNVEIQYLDLRDKGASDHAFPPLPKQLALASDVVRSRAGSPIAAVRVTPPRLEKQLAGMRARQRRVLSLLAILLLSAWLASAPPTRARVAGYAALLRLSLLSFGPPLPDPASPLLSPDVYSAAPSANPAWSWLAALFRSPLDLLLTALLLCALAALVLDFTLARAPRAFALWRALVADTLALPVVALVFLLLFDTVSQCALDLEDVAIVPKSAALLVMQAALLALLLAGAALLTALLALAGAFPAGRRATLLRIAFWGLLLLLALRLWPRERLGLPLLPALGFFLGAAFVAGRAQGWRARLAPASLDARAGLCLLGVAALALLLFPSLVHFDEKTLRRTVERTHAPLVLRQPEWRDYVLRETRRKIDDFGLLESEPQGPHPPEIEELAYAVWSATDLASFGFSSAIEIQDASGYVVSRFALNLPSISGASRPLPKSTDWDLARERSTVGSAERPVVHASRLLAYEGRVRGAVHVFVGDDFWNLPFLQSRDPYSVLYRRTPETPHRTRPLGLLVYDQTRGNVFSSDERPPALDPVLLQRVRAAGAAGLWTTLVVGGRQQHALLVTDGPLVYAITYARTDAGRYLADLIEAVLSLTLAALFTLSCVMLLRTLLGRRELSLVSVTDAVRRRFALRLFVAFMLVAIVPVLVLQNVVERFVTERLRGEAAGQALELAAVAKKAVEDYALFQRDEAPGQQPVTDAALVWVASLIQNDLDVFERGRLLASSKRELYASGLLPQRLSGEVYRAIELDGESSSLRTESIGNFSYQVVSVPLRFESGRRVLSIPLALRQREVEAVVEDLLRTIRLASLVFLAAAAALAISMSRRISGPVRELTAATHRVAAGDLAARVRATTRDEFETLVDSFNRMAQELERQRRDLERINKLAAWAEMARQVAHEVKNPLTPIQLAAEHLRRVYADKSADFERTLKSCTDTILEQVQNLREIVTEFSSFARPPATTPERLELQPLVSQVARSYQDVLPKEVRLELLPGAAPAVAADRRLVERAVVNLVENALQAVGEEGAIRLRVLEDGLGRAVVEVEDTGPGLDPEVKARIFEPFFSTKANGSGLGLALVKKIAEDHGGGVSIDSAPGETTRARLWFPPAS